MVNKRLGEDQTLCMFVYNLTSAVFVLPLALYTGVGPYTAAQVAGRSWLGISGVLGEGLHLSSFAGLALILLGFFVQKRFERRGKVKAQNPAQ